MVNCPNCNRFYNDDFKFCPYCGTKKPKFKICSNCEFKTCEEFLFCPECGKKLITEKHFKNNKHTKKE